MQLVVVPDNGEHHIGTEVRHTSLNSADPKAEFWDSTALESPGTSKVICFP